MTIESKLAKNRYIGNGSTVIFPFTFKIWEENQILVTVEDPDGLTDTAMPEKITLSENGGEIILYFDSEKKLPYPAGYKIAITRNMPFLQESDYINGSRINTEVIEKDLDIAAAERQQLLEQQSRSLIMAATDERSPEEVLQDFLAKYYDILDKYQTFFEAYGNIFCQSIVPFTTQDNVLEYELGTDYVDQDANNLLLVMDNVVQEPDVAYIIIEPNKIKFAQNPGAGKKVWGISSLPFSNPDIRAVVTKAIEKIEVKGTEEVGNVTQTGAAQAALVVQTGTEQAALVIAEGSKQIQLAKDQVAKAEEQALLSQAWAESDTNPDPNDPDSHSAKWWAMNAADVVPYATKTLAGKVQIGDGLDIGEQGILSLGTDVSNAIEENTQAISANTQAIYENTQDISRIENELAGGIFKTGDFLFSYAESKIGFLLCDGSAVSRTTYAALFAVIGTTFGAGDGSTTFNLPDLRGRFIQGAVQGEGGDLGSYKEAALPNITGDLVTSGTWSGFSSASGALIKADGTGGYPGTGGKGNSISARIIFNASYSNSVYGKSNTVQPPAIALNVFIKY